MYTKYVIVAIVFLSCALAVSWAACDYDTHTKKLYECRQLYNTAISGGNELSCSDVPRIDECFEQMKSACNIEGLGGATYQKMQIRKGICAFCGAPRPSFVLIGVTLMSILLTVSRF